MSVFPNVLRKYIDYKNNKDKNEFNLRKRFT